MYVPAAAIKFYCGTTGIRLPLINQKPLMTEEAAERFCMDLVKSEDSLGLEDLGISPSPIEKHLGFMEMYCKGGARQTFLEN
jgi:hypothetical protein